MNKLKLVLFLLLLLTSNYLKSQNIIERILNSNEKELNSSIEFYLKVYKNDTDDININRNLAQIYMSTSDRKALALQFVSKVIAKSAYSNDLDTKILLAQAYFYSEQFDSAINVFNECLKIKMDKDKKNIIKKYISYAINAKAYTKTPDNINYIKLSSNVNTNRIERFPCITPDTRTLIFASDRDSSSTDIFISFKDTLKEERLKASKIECCSSPFADEIPVFLSADGKYFIYSTNETGNFDLKFSIDRGKGFRFASFFQSPVNSKYNEIGACLSLSGDTLFFASDRPGGKGGYDIYYTIKLPDGNWGKIINFKDINTPDNEIFPRISVDGKTLLFSSDNENSIGGFDIFSYNLKNIDKNKKIRNLGVPVNSVFDNFVLGQTSNKRYSYQSISLGFTNSYDIYRIIFNNHTPGYVVLYGKIKIFDASTNTLTPAKASDNVSITVYDNVWDEAFGYYNMKPDNAGYVISLPPGEFTLEIIAEGCYVYKKIFKINESLITNKYYNFNITLQRRN